MKTLVRIFLYSSIALYITSLWNKGFVLPTAIVPFLEILILLAIVTYLIVPFSKVVLFPLHLITFGFLSVGLYMLFLFLASRFLGLLIVKPWVYPGGNFLNVKIAQITFSYLGNLAVISASISGIINTLEKTT